jgi:hypothetical protein
MRDIQIDGTPTAAAAPASTPKTRRRVMGTGRDHERRRRSGMSRYMACTGPTGTLRGNDALIGGRKFNHFQNINYYNGIIEV